METPVLSPQAPLDAHVQPMETAFRSEGRPPRPLFMMTSPELHMKRLLAAGSGPIFQMSRVFRNGEAGVRHNPEFTLLEWYRPGFDDDGLMQEVADLLAALGSPFPRPTTITYADAFRNALDLDPHAAPVEELQRHAQEAGLSTPSALDRDGLLDFLLAVGVTPFLKEKKAVFLTRYPASQAALARIDPEEKSARRFELFLDGLEIANGYHELADPREQRDRFEAENRRRLQAGERALPLDERFLAALDAGLPDCAGVAVGVDRLAMALQGTDKIADVTAFPFDPSIESG